MVRRATESFTLDKDYNGYCLCTDGKVFFTRDDKGDVLFEAKTLDTLKTKCRQPKELDIRAVILEPQPEIVRVYGVSPTGRFLYVDSKGKKDKTSHHGSRLRALRQPDESEVAKYNELRKAKIAAQKALETYVADWPTMDSRKYLIADATEAEGAA